MEARTVLAIDPGSSKCGMALVHRHASGELELLWRSVCPTDQLEERIFEAKQVRDFNIIVVGSGTRSQAIVHRIREALPSIGVLVIDERDTTLQARERYWEHHPRRGLKRILPSTMLVPPEPVDDFVALILAERTLGD
ncbi:MAG: hypothetical protein L6Q31_09840 [Fimbriimonadaceae bacterium]|nr:hypothetical protein [Fimbriimonadaceae bacterium]NUM38693.1 pre-16S rRNA-processing nuclease YqgF [Armatimonadota bacterium]